MHCAMPGIVKAFNPVTQLCAVQPAIRMKAVTNTVKYMDMPLIENVPLVVPSCNGFAVTLPVKPGDTCLLIFSDRSLDEFLDSGGLSNPCSGYSDDTTSPRQHALTDAICVPGLNGSLATIGNYNADALEIRTRDGLNKIVVADDGVSITSPGGFKVNGLDLMTHVHTSATSGNPTGPPIPEGV